MSADVFSAWGGIVSDTFDLRMMDGLEALIARAHEDVRMAVGDDEAFLRSLARNGRKMEDYAASLADEFMSQSNSIPMDAFRRSPEYVRWSLQVMRIIYTYHAWDALREAVKPYRSTRTHRKPSQS